MTTTNDFVERWYCQNINCGAKVPYNLTHGGSPTCPKCGGTWVGSEPPKPLTIFSDASTEKP